MICWTLFWTHGFCIIVQVVNVQLSCVFMNGLQCEMTVKF